MVAAVATIGPTDGSAGLFGLGVLFEGELLFGSANELNLAGEECFIEKGNLVAYSSFFELILVLL